MMRFLNRHAIVVSLKRLTIAIALAGALSADAYLVGEHSRIIRSIQIRSIRLLSPPLYPLISRDAETAHVDLRGGTDCFVLGKRLASHYLYPCNPEDVTDGYEVLDNLDELPWPVSAAWGDLEGVDALTKHGWDYNPIEQLLWCRIAGFSRVTGLWAPTTQVNTASLRIDSKRELSDAELDLIRAEVATWIDVHTEDSQDVRAWDRALKTNRSLQLTPIYAGYLHNTFALTLLLSFLYTLASTPFAVRRAYRQHNNRCRACDYSLDGLETDRCPECGATSTTHAP